MAKTEKTETELEFAAVLKSQYGVIISSLNSSILWLEQNAEKYGAPVVDPVLKEYKEALAEWQKSYDAL